MDMEAGVGRGPPGYTKPGVPETTRSPTVTGPKLLPKKKTISRQVFLAPELWAELTEVAVFQSEVFEEMKADEKVSRNDVIRDFLRWALDAYWSDKGGRPTSRQDRLSKVERHAAALLAEMKSDE